MAEHERSMISERTKAALSAAKQRGVKLGGYRGVSVNPALGTAKRQLLAAAFNERIFSVIADLRAEGLGSHSELARALNDRGIPTRRGGVWKATQVARVIEAIGSVQP